MPALAPVENFAPPSELTDFEKAVKSETYERGVHFYLDDYRFDDKICSVSSVTSTGWRGSPAC